MFKFVNANGESLNNNRKRVIQRACDACRRKKKRCHHHHNAVDVSYPPQERRSASASVTSESSNSIPIGDNTQGLGLSNDGGDSGELLNPRHNRLSATKSVEQETVQQRASSSRPNAAPETLRSVTSRFIGDTNPEGTFEGVRSKRSEADIGVWLTQNPNYTTTSSPDSSKWTKSVPPTSLFYGLTSPLQQVFLPLLEKECLSIRPPATQSAALCAIYFEKFQPILPVVDFEAYQALSPQSPSRILLQQGLCLVASMDSTSGRYLCLSGDDAVLSCEDFGQRLFASMRVLIEIGVVPDKVVMIQALLLMWHFMGSRRGGDASSFVTGKAVQYLHALGLHIQQRHNEIEDRSLGTLFCCVWTVDRLNATIQGRPVMMHERDIGRPLQECFAAQQPTFRLLLDVVDLLDRIISLYRPTNTGKEPEFTFDLYEDILARYETSRIPVTQLVTIEILYHTVAILSCRHRGAEHPYSTSSSSRTRQALSTRRVTAMMGQECGDLVTLFPFVPYSVSLCLSVAYRELRRSKISLSRARARLAFEENCHILDRLGVIFSQAATMADMGRVTLAELDRVYNNIVDSSRRKQSVHQALPHGDVSRYPHNVIEPLADVDAGALAPGSEPDLLCHSEMFDFNLFDMFTPNFDLDHVDSFLEGNLDAGLPSGPP